jgi:hypothetical protein
MGAHDSLGEHGRARQPADARDITRCTAEGVADTTVVIDRCGVSSGDLVASASSSFGHCVQKVLLSSEDVKPLRGGLQQGF